MIVAALAIREGAVRVMTGKTAKIGVRRRTVVIIRMAILTQLAFRINRYIFTGIFIEPSNIGGRNPVG